MARIDSLNQQIAAHADSIEKLREEKQKTFRAKIISCAHCNARAALSRFGFIQDYWYESPHGCMGGDHWHYSKTKLCHIVCPSCNTANYIYNHPDRAKIEEAIDKEHCSVESLFACVYDQHGDQKPVLRGKKESDCLI